MYLCRCDYRLLDFFFFQAEDGIRDLVRSRGLGDVYKRQNLVAAGGIQAIEQVIRVEGDRQALALEADVELLLSLIHI